MPEIEAIGSFDMLSYTAAFVDGDGSFSMVKKTASPSVSVYNNNPQLLKNIQPIIGGGLHQNFRGEWHLRIGSIANCKAVCELLLPKLMTKKRQAELLHSACVAAKADRYAIGEALSELNHKRDYQRPPDSLSLKIDTTKSATDWSYLGGYVDTDSNVELHPQYHGLETYYYPNLNIYCKDPNPILVLQSLFGGQFKSRKRKNGKWISSLQFEDQAHVLKILTVLRPFVLDKKAHIDTVLEACSFESKNRHAMAAKLRAINEQFHGLHTFMKTEDGKYVDGKRSTKKPHRTHKGKPLGTPDSPSDNNFDKGPSNESIQ